MRFENVYVPYGAYWSTPFARWQGSFAHLHPVEFAAETAARALEARHITPDAFDGLHFGTTVPSKHSFYGAPWLAGLVGATGVTGPTVNQACATSARVIAGAAAEVAMAGNDGSAILAITADRTSNGPHVVYPNPTGPGGTSDSEDWVWDNFSCDPFANNSMLETAENVAREAGITTEEQHEVVLMRYEQYQSALADDGAFLRRYMVTPIEVKMGRKVTEVVFDEGVFPSTAEGLAKLKPVLKDGTVTYGGQTFPADGNGAMVVATEERAREMSQDTNVTVQLLSFGEGRAKKGFMAQATVPAAQQALKEAGIGIEDLTAIKTHNPFAVNDIYFSRVMEVELSAMNNYGCSLIWGHPQGPTGMRLVIELIEEVAMLGGGYGLFVGCAAGDTAASVVLKVEVAQ